LLPAPGNVIFLLKASATISDLLLFKGAWALTYLETKNVQLKRIKEPLPASVFERCVLGCGCYPINVPTHHLHGAY
jgi:hypothetical protein